MSLAAKVSARQNEGLSPIGHTPESPSRPMNQIEASDACRSIRTNHLNSIKLLTEIHDRKGHEALGYKSWKEFVVREFGNQQSQIYRHLAAERTREVVAPETEPGAIPESVLRPITGLSDETKLKVFEEAQAAAGGPPTARDVQTAKTRVAAEVARQTPPPDPSEPAEIRRAKASGIIPDGAKYEVVDAEPDVPIDNPKQAAIEGDLSDDEWLDQCPARAKLAMLVKTRFDLEALAYRLFHPILEECRVRARPIMDGAKRKMSGHIGPYLGRYYAFLRINHPKHWLACEACGGSGQIPLTGPCSDCDGEGYYCR